MARAVDRVRAFRAAACVALVMVAATPQAESDPLPGGAPEVVATFHDGSGRVPITRELFEDYLAYHQLEPGTGASARLAALALVLRLEAEASRDELTPRLALELRNDEDRLLSAELRRKRLAAVSVSDEAVEAQLEKARQRGGLERPRKLHLSHIFKRLPPGADDAARQRLRAHVEGLRRRLLDGEDFATLARAESDSQTAANSGRLGVVRPGTLPEPLEEIAYGLKEGELSQVLANDSGFVILRCDKIVEAYTTTLDDARDQIRRKLERVAAEKTWERLYDDALHAAAPEIDLEAARGEAGDDAVALRFGKYRLTAQDVRWLARTTAGAPTDVEKLGAEELWQFLENHVVQTVLAERVREEPLDPALERRRRWQRKTVLANAGLRQRVEALFEAPSEKELRAFVAEHPKRFVTRDQFRLQVLRVDDDPENPLEAGRRIADLSRSLETGELPLDVAARQHSSHWSSANGGHVGWWTRKQLAAHSPALLREVLELTPGATTQPLHLDRSWWILHLLETAPSRPMTFEEARDFADTLLGNQRLAALQKKVEDQVARELELIVEPASATAATPEGTEAAESRNPPGTAAQG